MEIPSGNRRIHTVTCQIRSIKDTDSGLYIEGIANDAGTTDGHGTRFSFTDDCIERSRGLVVLYNHDDDNMIGINDTMDRMRDGSLHVGDYIHPTAQTPQGVSIPDLLNRGWLKWFSIRFFGGTIRSQAEYDLITPEYLPEHSLVTMPSNLGSRLDAGTRSLLRQLEQTPEGESIARIYRLGFSARELPGSDPTPELEATTVPENNTPTPSATPAALTVRTIDARTPSTTRAAGPLTFEMLRDRLSDLIREERRSEEYWSTAYLHSVYDDYCVWYDYEERKYYREGYQVDASGAVSLSGNTTEVLPTWVPAGTAGVEVDQLDRSLPASGTRELPEGAPEQTPAWVTEITQQMQDMRGQMVSFREEMQNYLRQVPTEPEGTSEAPAPEAPQDVMSMDLESVQRIIEQTTQDTIRKLKPATETQQ